MEKQLDFCSTLSWESVPADEHGTRTDTRPLKHTGTHMLRAPDFKNKTPENLGREKCAVSDSCGHTENLKPSSSVKLQS